ncbi:MAG: response regulator transcription factor [Anaerolineales bacterium]
MINVLLVDDHPVLRTGLRTLLEREGDLRVLAETGSGEEAILLAERIQPDVVIMDLTLPDLHGLDATREIRRRVPRCAVLVLTAHAEERYLFPVLQAGASGYVRKDVADDELVRAVRQVASGKAYLDPAAQAMLLRSYLQPEKDIDLFDKLSTRERQVLQLTAEGYSSREIGEKLHISPKSVETYRARVMEKLNISDRPSLVRYALRKGLLKEADEI